MCPTIKKEHCNKKFTYTTKKKLNTYENWEGHIIQIKTGSAGAKDITIANIYRPPRVLMENYREFLNELTPVLADLESNNSEKIMTGDFNIDLLKIHDKAIFSEYFDLLTSHSFFPKITLPTRFSNNHGTLIDNIFCKLSEATLDTTSGILIKKFSDHQPCFSVLNDIKFKPDPIKYVKVAKNDEQSIANFKTELISSPIFDILVKDPKSDPNINYNILHETILTAKEKNTSQKK